MAPPHAALARRARRLRHGLTGFDVLEILEQYYERSNQNPARFFEMEDGRFMMVLGLPGADPAWPRSLDRPSANEIWGSARSIDGRSFRFECGCSPAKMLRALRSIFQQDPEDLFGGEERVETSCPRCGRRWWVTRERFDAPPDQARG